ncbi:MAG: cyclic nucleotide-binding domain-containing protein, partial [Candidatus Methylomirabilia bacterium]
ATRPLKDPGNRPDEEAVKGLVMELVSRMMDGSLPYDIKGAPPSFRPPLGQDRKIEHLQKVPIFQECTRRQLRAVARITDVLEEPAGVTLTRAGEPGTEFFLIVDGTARVEVSAEWQPRLEPGDFFGEMSLLDGEPRSATVVAETAVRLLVINRKDFSTLLNKVPRLTQSILVVLSRRVRQAERAAHAH